jgi:NDP-sugar pyrophosphorylase family protein
LAPKQPEIGVIPVGGQGVRLKRDMPLRQPKVLLMLDGVEILNYSLLSLKYAGCKKIFCITSDPTHQEIEKFIFDSEIGIDIEVLNANARGTAKALYYLNSHIHECFYYTNGDIIFNPDILLNLCKLHESNRLIATVCGSPYDLAPTHPHFICDNSGLLLNVETWPEISYGSLCSLETGIFEPYIFEYLHQLNDTAMTMEALNLAICNNSKAACMTDTGFWYHLAEGADIQKFQQHKIEIGMIEKVLNMK